MGVKEYAGLSLRVQQASVCCGHMMNAATVCQNERQEGTDHKTVNEENKRAFRGALKGTTGLYLSGQNMSIFAACQKDR